MNTLSIHCVKDIEIGDSRFDSMGDIGYHTREVTITTALSTFTINLFYDCELHGK